jgi:hypothetical protein
MRRVSTLCQNGTADTLPDTFFCPPGRRRTHPPYKGCPSAVRRVKIDTPTVQKLDSSAPAIARRQGEA